MYNHSTLAATGATSGLMYVLGLGIGAFVLGLALLVLVKLLPRKPREGDDD